MSECNFSEEAEFIYSLFVKHYEENKISDHSIMIEFEEYEASIDESAFKQGLNELKETGLISQFKSFIDGSFDVTLRLKCESMLKSGQKILTVNQEGDSPNNFSNYNITINGNVSGSNAIGIFKNASVSVASTPIDFEKVETLIKQISANIKYVGFSENEKAFVENALEEIHAAIVRKDSSVVTSALKHIQTLCGNVTANLIASGIIQQISNLLP